jgi:molybdopterin-containing oxidoreductase family iron-sulfur binding subunit
MTKLVWDNAALISRGTRDALGVRDGQIVKLTREGAREISVPVFTLPGHADRSITLMLGWGRTAAGRYGNGRGFDVNPLRTADGFDVANGVRIEKTSEIHDLVQSQIHAYMEDRPIAIGMTHAEYVERPNDASFQTVEFASTPPLWREVDYSQGHKWGMTIDLSTCHGCNACVAACQSENNIPVVGKYETKRGRNMQWLRIDRYFIGADEDNPPAIVQPIACQQCEEAPCENVCPVNATAHSPEGLNDMAYNRCIGTRCCANNCPYKVRRFNYLDWHGDIDGGGDTYVAGVSPPTPMHGAFPEVRKMQFNPNVTVRSRGVMEKCTYCVQRIEAAKIVARREQRPLRDGEIVSACQQACPSSSIIFGDLNDPTSRVSQLAARDRGYKLLAEVGTQPRTTFLARITNPNPVLAAALERAAAASQEAHG